MCENYVNLVRNSQAILRRLNPQRPENSGNICPVAADAVDDYLHTGQVVSAPTDLVDRYRIQANWVRRTLPRIATRLRNSRNCRHVVVRGHRARSSQYAPTHYFVMMNVRGQVYIVDGWLRLITQDLNQYHANQEFHHYFVSSEYEASIPDVWDL